MRIRYPRAAGSTHSDFVALRRIAHRVTEKIFVAGPVENPRVSNATATDGAPAIDITADVFRESNAADIGFACVCHADYALPVAFNPKIEMIRDKTLMEGHDCCNHRYVYG